MAQEVRVGVAGLTHGHVWGLIDAWSKVEGAKLVAVADETPLLDKARDRFEKSYTDWREMLANEKLDALVVTSDNVESSEITVQALHKGIPCMVEKAMAANAFDAERMLTAMHESGKTLMINWPLAWAPWLGELQRRMADGYIGQPFHLRFRNGHQGPKEIGCDEWFVGWLYDETKNGGGAIADFGSYGAVLARWLMGMPETVYCIRGNFTKDYPVSDDHAVILLKYPHGTAFLEGTWATVGFDGGPNPVIHGKTGTLSVQGGDLILTGQKVEVPEPEFKNPAEYFLNCIRSGKQPEGILSPELSADACRILDAAIKSSKSGCAERPM
ncbi:Gfo/Idh/MocA family protein [Fimbriimonas ginsengisoli]|uniref:Oxidoreductase domain protein n=1 Tax=Fimbriimonas ginsengisoli Gsoil 348 TaxID=661478 RepID=A0A068NYX5_FIMGI|nr:Gfo/Idh/MocA family oxidoreductase [Fimbriimonas ginsengisoli]AIE87584.1 oxidoreductase domain protein [Fimbriimonas ginsengisoli Gsoil 348]